MGILRRAINLADNHGTRWALSAACAAASRGRLKVHYRGGAWHYSSGGVTIPRGPKFDFYGWDVHNLPDRIRHDIDQTKDCWFQHYEPKAGDTIVDVGAEIGTDAIVFSQAVGPTGRVIAIEAQPDTFQLLLKTCAANDLGNVTPIHMAVANKPGEVHISADAGVESNFLASEGIPVPGDTLDNILADIPQIDFLKMNIEGAEQWAIQGMDRTIEKTDCLAIACHDFVADDDWFRTLDKVRDYLISKGFLVSQRENDPRDYVRHHLHAVSPRK